MGFQEIARQGGSLRVEIGNYAGNPDFGDSAIMVTATNQDFSGEVYVQVDAQRFNSQVTEYQGKVDQLISAINNDPGATDRFELR